MKHPVMGNEKSLNAKAYYYHQQARGMEVVIL
jgi:hypothetical protein